MFDIGFSEMIVLGAIALIAIGPKQLPEVARTVGRMINEFKRATGDFTKTFTDTRDEAIRIANESRESFNRAPQKPEEPLPMGEELAPHAPNLEPYEDMVAREDRAHHDVHGEGHQDELPIQEEQLSFTMNSDSSKREGDRS